MAGHTTAVFPVTSGKLPAGRLSLKEHTFFSRQYFVFAYTSRLTSQIGLFSAVVAVELQVESHALVLASASP